MTHIPLTQPKRAAWMRDHLQSQQDHYLSKCINVTTKATYQLRFNSYLAFCYRHKFNLDLTPDTLSLFIAYMACQTGPSGHLISVRTINLYLSGVNHHL